MQTIDLISSYLANFIDRGDRSLYEGSFPGLFDHYYRFWANRERDIAILNRNEIEIRVSLINKFIAELAPILRGHGLDPDIINYIYFIGVGITNGHAFKHNEIYHVWLPLETYSNDERIRIFVTHEIIHALHYFYSPEFHFTNSDEHQHLGRQLITEGMASYLTMLLLSTSVLDALWADYLSEPDVLQWYRSCKKCEKELFCLIKEKFGTSDRKLEIFYANDPHDIYRFRAGYYAGHQLIERYAGQNELKPIDLVQLPRKPFERDIMALLNK